MNFFKQQVVFIMLACVMISQVHAAASGRFIPRMVRGASAYAPLVAVMSGMYASDVKNDNENIKNIENTSAELAKNIWRQPGVALSAVEDSKSKYSIFQIRNRLLRMAVRSGNVKLVKKLVDAGADIETRDLYGWTPLIVAASYDDVELLKYLIAAGANKENVLKKLSFNINDFEITALGMAAISRKSSAVDVLLEAGCDAKKIPLTALADMSNLQKRVPLNLQGIQDQSAILKECIQQEGKYVSYQDASVILDTELECLCRGNIPFAHGVAYHHGLYRYMATKMHNRVNKDRKFPDGYMMFRFTERYSSQEQMQRLLDDILPAVGPILTPLYIYFTHGALHGTRENSFISPFRYFKHNYSDSERFFSLEYDVARHYFAPAVIEHYRKLGSFNNLEKLYKATQKNEQTGLLFILEASQEFSQKYMRCRHVWSHQRSPVSSWSYIKEQKYDFMMEHIVPEHALGNPEIVNQHVRMHVIGIDFTSPEWKAVEVAADKLVDDLVAAQERYNAGLSLTVA